ncbi:MAG TPA: heavy metal translocating P-type ATPase [Dehalococcoidia bacterium]
MQVRDQRPHAEPTPPAPKDARPPARLRFLPFGPDVALLAVTAAGLALGGLTWLLRAPTAASWAWGLTAALALAPLGLAVARALLQRRTGVDVIAALALLGALILGEYLAGAVIAVMFATGQALEGYADRRARRDLTALLARAPQAVTRYRDGGLQTAAVEAVQPGDRLLIRPGDVVPVDGIAEGVAVLDESALTGEARLVERQPGDTVRSGVVNAGSPFDLRATATAAGSTYAGIVRLVAEAQAIKAPFVRLADRYATAFLPLTLVLAGLAWLISGDPVRALAVLVVATPCPLILAAPIAIVAGLSRGARRGIVVKGGGALETLARVGILVLDKTGTITAGRPFLTDIEAQERVDAETLLWLAASLDQVSSHVLAGAVVRAAYERGLRLALPLDVTEEPGRGVRGRVDGRDVAVGSAEWVTGGRPVPGWAHRLRRRTAFEGAASVFVAVDGALAGALVLEDPIRPDAARTLRALRRIGIREVVLLSGDHADVAEPVGAAVGVDAVLAEQSPEEKVAAVQAARARGTVAMVGDGINDAPALAAADVGVAMGARGATASSEAADVVLVVDRLDRLVEAVRVARRSRRIALQSVLAGMGLSLAAMLAAAAGYLPPAAGAFLQEGIDLAVILNALRALTGARPTTVSRGPEAALSRRFQAEHAQLLPLVNRVRAAADRLGRDAAETVLAEIRTIHGDLVERLLPHEEAEETVLYPVVARLVGGEDPTGPMSRAHVEISRLTRLLGRLLDDLPPEGPDADDVAELRRVLYGLHAILRLHFAQEEEAYLSLAESAPGPS